jgi:hypothetical protein
MHDAGFMMQDEGTAQHVIPTQPFSFRDFEPNHHFHGASMAWGVGQMLSNPLAWLKLLK